MTLSQSLGNLSHHAYGIVSDVSLRLDVISFLEGEYGIVTRGNPDLYVQKYEVLTIDDARSLKTAHATRPFSSRDDKDGNGGRKFFILEIDSITREAQNALLKIFEEPNEYAHFFLIIPSEELLLPTLRSRLFMVRETIIREGDAKIDKNLVNFLSSSKAERLALVDKLAADIADDKKPKSAALDFCADLSKHLHHDGVEKNAAALVAIAKAESYLRDRAPSIKQLLEYVALRV
jgi:DNA polymerase III delta prime subunit